ncbi:IclR family transcriptional regulator [Usitatibacter palustris]|uniref:Pectin degradation repressor protein KdgR n=1 Tax=Usitatibacter palustris TaxID=2732487 RepID=A0A6M4H5W2_9PROT|nr:IclR family transcriptional regulator [Usitatibacter palustris]QJR15006.1 Pectin degradation repressor protein KdgR [Usitatibacter palustris]
MEQTVRKAFDVLEALARAREPRRLTDLARELSLTKPNVYRLLSTLSELGYVSKEEATSRYSATLKLWELGSVLVRDGNLIAKTAPRLRELAEASHESVQLAVYDAGFAVFVNKLDSPRPIKAMTTIGSRVPAACASTGKAILAFLPDREVTLALSLLKRFTPLTRMRRVDLDRDLESARKQGYAVNHGEWRAGVCGIAAPVRDSDGHVIASLGVWGAEDSILGPRREELSAMVLETSREASRDFGFTATR